ncbi:MAG: 4Fe-4S binding protein [Proteobacteria bacterium]|nr:4Fe-4S binding protein [Pseudomonadota bacterium]MBU1542415.1 4Fe-4S binding protein [Pseudomonadota bacterium]MBU2431232.1 4Fe-4S binding protein [Pseudomonadota bacterium]MBU2482791.1 4Fe-4S binding protein [Pseudomonadota bacterium]
MKEWFKIYKMKMSLFSMRRLIQLLSCIIVLTIGIQFYIFVAQLEEGIIPSIERPPGVEAFLPISALVSLKQFLVTGKINTIHPSALVIFLIVCMTALIVKKGFCGWVCPIGLLSDILAKLNSISFKQKVVLPIWADVVLRSIKYGLAGFFIWSIFYKMPIQSIEQFIQSPYNQFADIKMLHFFTHISNTALTIIFVLILLSFVIPYFWCRHLCPYGAVLGVFSFLSIGKIKRNPSNCTNCGRCEKNCPSLIKIRKKESIHSSECTACMTCVKNCPEKQTIGFSLSPGNLQLGQAAIALILISMFSMSISIAKASGNWQNEISKQAYLNYVMQNTLPWNSNGSVDPQKMEKMIRAMKNIQAQKP